MLSIVGCRDPQPGLVGVVQRVEISTPAPTLRPGRLMTAVARAFNADGGVVELPALWRTLTPALLAVEESGELRALAPGTGIVEAVVGGVTGRLEIPLVNPPAALIRIPSDSILLSLPGSAVLVSAVVFDSVGEEIIAAQVAWSSEAARIAAVSASGLVTPAAVGTTSITAALDGVQVVRTVRVTPVPSATAPIISQLSTTTVLPGVPFTIRGERFGSTIGANTVMVDGLPALVTSASATELTVALSGSGVPCLATRTVAVQVSTSGGVGAGSVRLQVAPQRALAVGDALILPTASAAACNEFADGTGRYVLALQHGGRALGAGSISLALEGRAGAGELVTVAAPSASLRLRSSGADAHARILEASAAAVQHARAAPAPRPTAALQIPPVNGIVQVRIPDLTSANLCNTFTTIGARNVYEGTRVAILEDTASQRNGAPTLAGSMDDLYAQLGQEFDAVLWPLAQRFGDPLVMDSRLDANNRVVLVATPRLNEMFNGEILGAVVTCDLYSRTQFASSNVGEVIYLQVPTTAAAGIGPGTRDRWRYEIRGTIAHELKHIVSFASRVVRTQPLEESWLEEATARHAEELFARARLGFSATGNAGYGVLDCEVRILSGAPDCAETPRTMLPHFEGLWDFLNSPITRSPLGATSPGDVSFYGSGWSLTRWAIDHSGRAEEMVLQELTASGQSGITNLEGRVGRSWDDILGRWALALAAESRSAEPADVTLRFPSWNLADVFGGLCTNTDGCVARSGRFSRPRPLRPTLVSEPSFTLAINELVPGGFSVVEVAPGAPGTRRLLRLRGANGDPLPPTARLAILRVE